MSLVGVPTGWGRHGRPISTPPPTDASSPNQATGGRALRGFLARNFLADTTSGARKGTTREEFPRHRPEPTTTTLSEKERNEFCQEFPEFCVPDDQGGGIP
jgi:hypothetical protein